MVERKSPIDWVKGTDTSLIMRTGDAIAVGLLAAAAIAAVRAVLPVVLLGFMTQPIDLNCYALALLVVAAAAIGFIWRISSRALVRLSASPVLGWLIPVPGQKEQRLLARVPWVLLIGSLGLYGLLGILPRLASRGGVLFAFDLALVALTGIVAGLALVVARRAPPEAFQRLHLHSAPMLSLMLVIVFIAGMVPAAVPIHQVQTSTETRPSQPKKNRYDLPTTINKWTRERSASSSADCRRTVTIDGRTAEIMPMLLVASEGGGVRAAEWTVQAMQRIANEPCAQHAVLFSSGVSGGAVGLALLRFNNHPDRMATAISNSRALSYGLIGFLVRDFTYAGTGIPLPALDHGTGFKWVDRGSMMEDAWDDAAPRNVPTTWQGLQFLAPPKEAETRQAITGPLILNSMSVGNACRVWVSEIELMPETREPTPSSDEKLDCDHAGTPGLRSVDLISRYGAFGSAEHPADGENRCLYGLNVSTAALLSARFPYVTPSGHVGKCARFGGATAPLDQLVDGGYLENTGLGTINDLSDVWLPKVREWNTKQLKEPRPKLIVPLVAYLDNDAGTDKNAPKRDITNEALLPPLAKLHAGSGATADQASLQRASDLVAPDQACPSDDAFCKSAIESIKGRIYDIYPASSPQISAPLGWVLSTVSRKAMAAALDQQEKTPCPQPKAIRSKPSSPSTSAVCSRGYGSLHDLKDALRRGPL